MSGRPRHAIELGGERYTLADLAAKLGLKRKTLEKRRQRGTPLLKPLQRHVRE